MSIKKEKLEMILRTKFPDATLEIVDLVGDEDHYSIVIKDKVFAGKSRIEQHKIVNNALKEELKSELHAMTLKTSI